MSEVDVADGTVPSPQNFRTALVPCRELLTTRPRSKGKWVYVQAKVIFFFKCCCNFTLVRRLACTVDMYPR